MSLSNRRATPLPGLAAAAALRRLVGHAAARRLPLGRGQGLHRQGVQARAQLVGKQLVEQAVPRQQGQIDLLLREVAMLRAQTPADETPAFRSLRDELPPHY